MNYSDVLTNTFNFTDQGDDCFYHPDKRLCLQIGTRNIVLYEEYDPNHKVFISKANEDLLLVTLNQAVNGIK